MKKIMKNQIRIALIIVQFLFLFSCERSATQNIKSKTRSNNLKTSIYGGCDFKTECWDYLGETFSNDFDNSDLAARCQAEKGQFVANGCRTDNEVAKCLLQQNTSEKVLLHFYQESGLTLDDATQLCEIQNGTIQNKQ